MNNSAQVTILGGAGEHGRSCYLVQNHGTHVLLDCGVKKKAAGEYPLLTKNIMADLDAVFLSHAHEDHSMAIPLLYKLGYTGKVWTTRATAQQLSTYIAAWKKYIKGQAQKLPYNDQNIRDIQFAYIEDAAPPGQWFYLSPSLRICWGKSGHILGSIWLLLNIAEKTIFFSGDFTAESQFLSIDWPLPALQQKVDLAIIDAAYGMATADQNSKLIQLKNKIKEVLQRGGSLLLPTPAFGRGQELLVWTAETFPDVQLLIEKELLDGLKQMLNCPQWLRAEAVARINQVLASKQIIVKNTAHKIHNKAKQQQCIVFTSDGMMQSDKSQSYYHSMQNSPGNCVILTGHLAKGSFGDRLLSLPPIETGCEVQMICYKVHQGLGDVRNMLKEITSNRTLLVHAEKPASDALCKVLSLEGFRNLYSLVPGDKLSF